MALAGPGPGLAAAQEAADLRPRPFPAPESPAFARAVARGTRTRSGRPGPAYWQQEAAYRLQATLDTAEWRLTGSGTVRYHNRSPDTLRSVWFHLHQNLFASGAPRNEATPVTGGMDLTEVAAQGRPLDTADTLMPGYRVDGTRLRIQLPQPLLPGDSAEFGFRWTFRIAPEGAPRGGTDGEVAVVTYWYPQLAVYDDLSGWQIDPYLGNAEFHMGFADYDVEIAVPAGWLIGATGTLTNAETVLSLRTRERLARAAGSRAIVAIVTEAERGAGAATAQAAAGILTWRFAARQMRDFAFGASGHYLWDAAETVVGDRDGDGGEDRALVQTFYRPSRRLWAWDQSARYAQHSIEFLSRFLWPYPWPQATAIDGVDSCSGMEYPMLTCIGGPRDTLSLYSVIVHELAHMWFPMQVASDEKRHAWLDEGLTRFNQAQGMREFFRGYDREALSRERYLALAESGGEVELMRHGDLYPAGTAAYGVASYDKMAVNLASLRGLLGEQRFLAAYRAYGTRWRGKHPSPWDFFYTFNEAAGEDLWWFWRAWWYETWTLDQAVVEVRAEGDATYVVLEDRGLVPMPVRLAIRGVNGGTFRYEVPVQAWLDGKRRHELRLSGTSAAIASIEIDPERLFPDIDRSNNVWSRLGGGR